MIEEAAISKKGLLSEQNIRFYHDYGFLIAEDLFDTAEISEIKNEAIEIFRGKRGLIDGMVEMPDDAPSYDLLKNYIAIHFPHKISRKVIEFVKHKKVVDILTGIVSPNVKCMQSMLFVKAPGKPGQSWHQDEYFIPTRDKSLTGVWIAADDADVENGCLWVIPGSHKNMPITQRLPYNGSEYGDVESCDLSPFSGEEAIPVEVKKGSVVFFNGYLFHSSLRNKTKDRFRMALVSHYMSAESMLPWDQDGKFELKEDMRDIIMVAGKDPYDYKGVQDLNKPYLRPEILVGIKK